MTQIMQDIILALQLGIELVKGLSDLLKSPEVTNLIAEIKQIIVDVKAMSTPTQGV